MTKRRTAKIDRTFKVPPVSTSPGQGGVDNDFGLTLDDITLLTRAATSDMPVTIADFPIDYFFSNTHALLYIRNHPQLEPSMRDIAMAASEVQMDMLDHLFPGLKDVMLKLDAYYATLPTAKE